MNEYKTSLNGNDERTEIKEKETPSVQKQQKEEKSRNRNTKKLNVVSKTDVQEILKKSIITPEFEKLHSVPAYDISEKKLRELRKVLLHTNNSINFLLL